MIYYLVTPRFEHTIKNYLAFWAKELEPRFQILFYNDVLRASELPLGTYIFSDLERLTPAETEIATRVWEQLNKAGAKLLNHPRRTLKRYDKPVWVTENGIDDRTGLRRTQFLHDHLNQVLDARADGVDVQSYLHWSLLDNFEWLEAWGPRFGLYRVDFETLERTPTPAVKYFQKLATGRELLPP